MTVRAILDSKGHDVLSVEPDAKLSAAIKLLGDRKIGAVLVMNQGHLEGILSALESAGLHERSDCPVRSIGLESRKQGRGGPKDLPETPGYRKG